jgi:dihydrofolate synthase/folylpolyglutamate synthase
MTFREAERHLLGLELFGMRFGLDRMHKLTTALGMPQRRFAQIHVVGSNGKSSTVRFAAAILARHGLRTGTYTSPHLTSFRERIEVGEEPVSEGRFAAAVQRAAHAAALVERTLDDDDPITQFELLTAAAFHELGASGVEVAVIEAGLGGRYDATNVIPSRVQVLTGVGLEHTRWLGPTVTDVAREKLAVVRDHATLVCAPLVDEGRAVAREVAAERRATLIEVDDVGAPGDFQGANFAVAAAAAEAFLGRPLDPAGVQRARAETRVPGRLDIVGQRPLRVLDGAHNPAGARALAAALPSVVGEHRPLVLVVSVLEDKDAAAMLAALAPLADAVVFTRCSNPRALSPGTLAALTAQLPGGPPAHCETVADPEAALARAAAVAGPGGAVVATGSIYLVGDLVRGSEEGAARARPSSL